MFMERFSEFIMENLFILSSFFSYPSVFSNSKDYLEGPVCFKYCVLTPDKLIMLTLFYKRGHFWAS